jgi:hypothetical protein
VTAASWAVILRDGANDFAAPESWDLVSSAEELDG